MKAKKYVRKSPKISGENTREGVLLRESHDGQLASWRAAAQLTGMTFSNWARAALDAAAKKSTG